jgi:glycosyltransferase involved in cell wall biosynthesis
MEKNMGRSKLVKVSCIIPAHNEAKRILSVLAPIYNHPLLSEIIVVQNFSTDNTSDVVRKFIKKKQASKIRLLEENSYAGKAHALYKGAEKSKSDILLFIDADLIGIRKKNITDILGPILKNNADLSLGFRGDGILLYKILKIDPIGGERAITKKLFFKMPDCRNSKFAVESLMNDFLVKEKKRIAVVNMPNVKNTLKYKKSGFIKGPYYDFLMLKDILSRISIIKFFKNLAYFVKNAKKYNF